MRPAPSRPPRSAAEDRAVILNKHDGEIAQHVVAGGPSLLHEAPRDPPLFLAGPAAACLASHRLAASRSNLGVRDAFGAIVVKVTFCTISVVYDRFIGTWAATLQTP